jgi:hypothetical protein
MKSSESGMTIKCRHKQSKTDAAEELHAIRQLISYYKCLKIPTPPNLEPHLQREVETFNNNIEAFIEQLKNH